MLAAAACAAPDDSEDPHAGTRNTIPSASAAPTIRAEPLSTLFGARQGRGRARGLAWIETGESSPALLVVDEAGRGVTAYSGLDGEWIRDYAVCPPDAILEVPIGAVRGPSGRSSFYVTADRVWATTTGVESESAVVLVDVSRGTVVDCVTGQLPSDAIGFAVDNLGDVDDDGTDDLLIGAPQCRHPVPTECGPGYAVVYSVAKHEVVLTVRGARSGDCFGWSVAGLGDVDGDGVFDFAVGAPGAERDRGVARGTVTVFSGNSGQPVWSKVSPYESTSGDFGYPGSPMTCAPRGDLFGSRLRRMPDCDDDGVDDLVVVNDGVPGIVTVCSGADGHALAVFKGGPWNAGFGRGVATSAGLGSKERGPVVLIGAPGHALGETLSVGALVLARPQDGSTTILATGTDWGGKLGHGLVCTDRSVPGLGVLLAAREGGLVRTYRVVVE